jgi:hypothetical protein
MGRTGSSVGAKSLWPGLNKTRSAPLGAASGFEPELGNERLVYMSPLTELGVLFLGIESIKISLLRS